MRDGKPVVLDLCSGAGGAARGYQNAGFYVIGVDLVPQPHYCGDEFILGDALTFPLDGYDLIHASPPCQRFSDMRGRWKDRIYPDLLSPIRERLARQCTPWIIENVEGAPGPWDFFLCGQMFGLSIYRHRLFQTTFRVPQPWHPRAFHAFRANGTKGTAEQRNNAPIKTICGNNTRAQVARDVMGMQWATRAEVVQAIPPAYTEYIGRAWLTAKGSAA